MNNFTLSNLKSVAVKIERKMLLYTTVQTFWLLWGLITVTIWGCTRFQVLNLNGLFLVFVVPAFCSSALISLGLTVTTAFHFFEFNAFNIRSLVQMFRWWFLTVALFVPLFGIIDGSISLTNLFQ
jgi:hypothetical protein